MYRMLAAATAFLAVALALPLAQADGPGPDDPRYAQTPGKAGKGVKAAAAPDQPAEPVIRGQTGQIQVAGGAMTLTVPTGYYYYPASEARAHLQRIGAPAPNGDVLGMIALAEGPRPVDDGFWGAVISYAPIGYVAEDRADRFAAPDFLQEVQAARTSSGGAQPQGFAAAPAHDGVRHIVVWTESYPAATQTARSLRHEQRLLGRQGVAGTTVVARADQMPIVNAAAPQILNMIAFAPGRTYSSYQAGRDPAAVFDLPGVVTLKPLPAQTAQAAPPPATTTTPSTSTFATPAKTTIVDQPADTSTNPFAGVVQWLPWVGGGLLLLALIPVLVGYMQRNRNEPVHRDEGAPASADSNITPTD